MGMGWRQTRSRRSTRPRKPTHRASSRVVLVGGSQVLTEVLWEKIVEPIASHIVARGVTVLWCGMGTGVAGAIVRSVLANGGKAEAVVVEGDKPPGLPKGVLVHHASDLFDRTRKLVTLSEGVLVVPGGIGTLMEATTFMALAANGDYPHPVVVYSVDRWAEGFLSGIDRTREDGATVARDFWSCSDDAKLAVDTATNTPLKTPASPSFRKRLPNADVLQRELFDLAQRSDVAFRHLTPERKLARLGRRGRDPTLPAFVVVVHQTPAQRVFNAAFLDPDPAVQIAAADRASGRHVRGFAESQIAATESMWKWRSATTTLPLLKRLLGRLDEDVRSEAAALAGEGHKLLNLLSILEFSTNSGPEARATGAIEPNQADEVLAWNEPWPLLLLARSKTAAPAERATACRRLMERLGADGGAARVNPDLSIGDALREVARSLGDTDLAAAIDAWSPVDEDEHEWLELDA